MDYTECLKVHGYIADKTDSENSNVEEIYNRYKPPPVPYDEFKHRVVTIYADSSTTSQNNNHSSSGSNTFPTATHTAQPSATVQRNRSTRRVSNGDSILQQQLDQFVNSYQQRPDTPIRDILSQPNPVRGRTRERGRARVQTPPPRAPAAVVVPQPASSVYTVPPPAANIPVHNTWTARRAAAVHSEPTRPPSPSRRDVQVPYQPLPESTAHQPARRRQQQQQQEEEMNDCCCCIC